MVTIPCFGGKHRFGQCCPSVGFSGAIHGTKKFSVLPLEAVRRSQFVWLGICRAHGEPTMRKKAAPGEIAMLALRVLVGPPLLLQVGLFRSFLNCTWNGGFP